MQTILALDCATKTGWAIGRKNGDGAKLVESGVQVFDVRRGESPGLRFARFRSWLAEIWQVGGPFDLVIYEQAHHRGGAATELCVGMTTRVVEWAAEHGIEHAAVHTGTLKKAIGGHGHADKVVMMRKAQEMWDALPQDDNEADALCLLRYAIDNYG
jgi:Holliday junction resolvasome RuvABC endonuclease subunit